MCPRVLSALLLFLAAWNGGSLGNPLDAAEHATKKPGSRWAVLIGVDDYAELGKLRFAGADQQALATQILASGFSEDQIFLLHDKARENKYRPFRENIEKQLSLVFQLVGPGDLIIISFSGHGVQLDGKSYLCPVDTRLDKLADTMIPLEKIYDGLAKSKATLRLLLVDACRNDFVPAGRRSVSLSRSLGEFAGAVETPPKGILLLSSCDAGQVSMEDETVGHGVFMHYMLEGLQGKAANEAGVVLLAGLYDYASFQTKKHVARKFNEYQTPALRGEIGGPFEICTFVHRPPGPATPVARSTPGQPMPEATGATITNSIGMKLVLIPAGEFMMGNEEGRFETLNYFPYADPSRIDAELPHHRVRITRPFYMGKYTVTLGEFLTFYHDVHYQVEAERDGQPSSGYGGPGKGFVESPDFRPWAPGWDIGMDHPAVLVSWNDAVAFCEWLSKKEHKTYRLPTEAEWEYACRAGTQSRYHFGNDPEELVHYGNGADQDHTKLFTNPDKLYTPTLDEQGNVIRGPERKFPFLRQRDGYASTSPVGRFRPNAFGLYDMHGNVTQWCSDWFDSRYYDNSPVDDPKGPDSGVLRVRRCASFSNPPDTQRCAFRGRCPPSQRASNSGFRIVCER